MDETNESNESNENNKIKATSQETNAESKNKHLRQELSQEIDALIKRIQAISDYTPPPYSEKRLAKILNVNAWQSPLKLRTSVSRRLQKILSNDIVDVDMWKGAWYMLNYSLEYQADFLKRRMTGDYETDEWGLDWELIEVVRPFYDFMYNIYWRVETNGLENIPNEGPVLLVSNHSGQLPWDKLMVATAVANEHPTQRLVRSLYSASNPKYPFLSILFERSGQVLNTLENGTRLLKQEAVVAVYPEGAKGLRKLYKDRYRLTNFEQEDFIKMALDTQAPIIPVSVVGAEELYISLFKSSLLATITRLPYFPISPTFPWLGLLGLIPLPSKWYIDFGEAISTSDYNPDPNTHLALMPQLSSQVRNTIQQMIDTRLAQRRSVLLG